MFFSRTWGSLEWPPPKWQWGSDIITTWVLLHVTTCGKTNYKLFIAIPNLSSLIGAINIYKPPNDPIWGRVFDGFCIQFTSIHHIEPLHDRMQSHTLATRWWVDSGSRGHRDSNISGSSVVIHWVPLVVSGYWLHQISWCIHAWGDNSAFLGDCISSISSLWWCFK